MPACVGGRAPRPGFLERQVGHDRGGDAGGDAADGRSARGRRGGRCCSTHHRQRDADVELASLVEDRHRRRAGLERHLRRLLDDRTVHHRIGERDADLDRVGAGRGDGAHGVLPTRQARR